MHRRDLLISTFAAGTAVAMAHPAAAQPRRPATIRARDGVQLFHRDWGEGRTVVFASSWALSSEMWAYQVAHMADAGFRCVAYDRRGHGRSDVPAGGYDMDTLADDLAAVIDATGSRQVDLVGHSSGCAEIIRYVARHGSGRARRIAMLAPAAPYLVKTADNPYGAPAAYHEATQAAWKRDFPKWAYENQAPFFTPETSPAMKEWATQLLLATPVPVAVATMKAVLAKDLRPDLGRVDRPTLILHGDKDASAPVDITGRRVAAGIRGSELRVYPGAPHGLFVTHVDQVNRDLEAFLKA